MAYGPYITMTDDEVIEHLLQLEREHGSVPQDVLDMAVEYPMVKLTDEYNRKYAVHKMVYLNPDEPHHFARSVIPSKHPIMEGFRSIEDAEAWIREQGFRVGSSIGSYCAIRYA